MGFDGSEGLDLEFDEFEVSMNELRSSMNLIVR